MTDQRSRRGRRLGIILLDEPHLAGRRGLFDPSDIYGLGGMPTGFFESPSTWQVPSSYCVASGITDLTDDAQFAAAPQAVQAAVDVLSEQCDTIVADCGLFYRLRSLVVPPPHTDLRLSGLEQLEAALAVTDRRVAIVTLGAEDLTALWPMLPQTDRLDVIELTEQPSWGKLTEALSDPDYPTQWRNWPTAQLREEALHAVAVAMSANEQAPGAIVIECTFIVQFASAIATAFAVPVYDVTSGAALLRRTAVTR